MSDFRADAVTLEFFDALLPTLKFELLTYPNRYGYEGAGPRCLYAAAPSEELDVLYEGGVYTVYGFDGMETWCVSITDDGQVDQLV